MGLQPLTPPEKSRTYHFPKGEKVVLQNVTHFLSRPSGTHRLKTADGKHWIVPVGWLGIELEVENFTV